VALGLEAVHVGIEHADAVGVALVGVAAEQLLADAYSKYGLPERANHLVQSSGAQVFHGAAGLALSWKYDAVSLSQLFGVVGQ
jgi:hypothetical protein